MEANTMASLIADLTTVITAVFGWVSEVATAIVDTPLLLIGFAFFILGGCIGIFSRLLARG